MPHITRQTLDQISEWIRPFAHTPNDRRTLLLRAFGVGDQADNLIASLELSDTTSNFTTLTVTRLIDYGDFEPGQPALRLLLEAVREQVGPDKQAEIDVLLDELYSDGDRPQLDPATTDYAPPSGEHVFVSYSRADKATVLRFIADIEAQGVRVWVDQSGLTPGTPDWEQALRDAIRGSRAVILAASPDSRRSAYVKDELRIAQMYKRPIYPVWVAGDEWMDSIPMGLGGVQFVDIRGAAYAAGVQRIAASLADAPPAEKADTEAEVRQTTEIDNVKRNPYKGLQAFTAQDKPYFFGRDALLEELVSALEEHDERFLAVVGASGSGKSSVVMAGLLPRLQTEHPAWVFLDRVVPGRHPLEALAKTLAAAIPGSLTPQVLDALQTDGSNRSLHLLASQITEDHALLFIDQFEELFTLASPRQAQRFIDLLVAAATEPDGPLVVVLTMRADFMDRPLAASDLARLFQHDTIFMKPMSVGDLRDVITRPAALQGLTFDENLVGDLLFEVRGEIGALPLLQFTLEQLYERREGDRLTRAAYEDIGGVRGAIARQAELTYDALPSERHRQLARTLFLRLIEPGETEHDTTRRRVDEAELTLADEADTATLAEVATAFINARLLVSNSDSPLSEGVGASSATYEVAHEALIREWERLKAWLRASREDVRVQKAVNTAAAAWVRLGSQPNDPRLYRGSQLDEATDWANRNTPSADEAAFISASVAAQQAQIDAEEARIRELREAAEEARTWNERALRTRHRLWWTFGTALAMIVVAIVVAYFAIQGQQAARAEARSAAVQVANAEVTLTAIPQTLAPVVATARAVETQIAAVPPTLTQVADQIAAGEAQIAAIESQRLAALSERALEQPDGNDETAALLAIRALAEDDTREARNALQRIADQPNYRLAAMTGHIATVSGAVELSDGRLLSWAEDEVPHLWDADGTLLATLNGHTERVNGAMQLTDGRLSTWSEDGTLRLWNTAGEPLTVLENRLPVKGATELTDGRLLTWSEDGTLRLWSAEAESLAVLDGHTGRVWGAEILADGRILSWAEDDTLRLWAADGTAITVLEGHTDRVWGAEALADGRLLSWSQDGTLRLWAAEGDPITVLAGHTAGVFGAELLADGRILSWSGDGTLRLWEPDDGTTVLAGHTGSVWGAEVLADERILSWGADGTLRLWAAEGDPITVLEGHTAGVFGAEVLADGRILSWSDDHTLRLWSMAGPLRSAMGEPLTVLLEGHTAGVFGAELLTDGRILSWGADGTLRLWAAEGDRVTMLTSHTSMVRGAELLADGRILSWGADGTLRLWAADGAVLTVFRGHTASVLGVEVLADGRILSWSRDDTLRLWAADGAAITVLEGHTGPVLGAQVLADGRILSWSEDDTLRLWAADGAAITVLEGHTGSVLGAQVLADGRILSWSEDETLHLWADDGAAIAVLEGHTGWVLGAQVLADGRILSWSADGVLRLWADDGAAITVLEGHTGWVLGTQVLADGRILSWSADGTLRLWEPDGTLLAVLDDHRAGVRGALELNDGRILSWAQDRTLRLWEPDGTLSGVLVGHGNDVSGATELADGRLLSWSRDDTLRLWSAVGDPLAVFEGHGGYVVGALELADGRLLSWAADNTLRLWYPDREAFIAAVCDTYVYRDFIPSERAAFNIPDEVPTCPKFAGG